MGNLAEKKSSSVLGTLWEGWKRVAIRIADWLGRIVLFLFYFIIVAPFALAVRWFTDPLAMKPGAQREWRLREEREGSAMERAMRQY